ncbi:MAG: phytanoyl-CoA dioxygenase family protein [Actinomycetota bacterium]|jgi:ectoine hydroxylase-related dioxygenase (phytanoyl-CoA dioxygenase family)|nr:phytanoyl-CoA dioxygenase family protein [Actinomycetota bacterium]|tara:strand:+ start:44556 stop:45389 length:834 start_codon:yes stop_codon:yes gene_type:complete
MGKVFTEEQIRQYEADGWVSPVDLLTSEQADKCRNQLEAWELLRGGSIPTHERSGSHILFPWIDQLMRAERILDAVEDLIGPNILCWNSVFWIKEAQSSSYVGWHQDLQYWGLSNSDVVSIWIALSNASEDAGCMNVIPGSHKETIEHAETYAKNNLLSRGQELEIDISQRETVPMALKAGQVSFHNVRTAHGSGPNKTNDRRIGLSFHYMPPHTEQTLSEWDCASLVRGTDQYRHFEHCPQPSADLEANAVDFHKRASDAMREIIYKGSSTDRRTL